MFLSPESLMQQKDLVLFMMLKEVHHQVAAKCFYKPVLVEFG